MMKRNPDFILRNIAGEDLLVPVGDMALQYNGLITLNGVAKCIWENINEHSEEEIIDIILDKYEVTRKQASDDVYGLIKELKAFDFILDENQK